MADGWSGSSVTVFLNFFQTWGADFCCTLRVDLYIHSVCCQRLLLLRNCITAANCQQLCLQLQLFVLLLPERVFLEDLINGCNIVRPAMCLVGINKGVYVSLNLPRLHIWHNVYFLYFMSKKEQPQLAVFVGLNPVRACLPACCLCHQSACLTPGRMTHAFVCLIVTRIGD